jgi:proteasome lid subunit RPN8/RPN11
MAAIASVRVPQAVRRAILDHARSARPLECCGLLVGRKHEVLFAWPVRNVAESPVRFEVDARAHIDLRRVVRRFVPTLAIVGVYHSHPRGPASPSPADIDEALYADWIHLIVGLAGGRARMAAFRIRGGRVRPLTIEPSRSARR